MTSKKQSASASADSANDAVPVDETVRVPQNLINGKKFKSIELRIDYKSVLALARHLIKPSVLCVRAVFFLTYSVHMVLMNFAFGLNCVPFIMLFPAMPPKPPI